MKFIIIAAALLGISAAHAGAADVEVKLGQMKPTYSGVAQVVAAKNNGPMISTLWIECGFFKDGQLVAADKSFAEHVEQGQTVYIDVTARTKADSADCRARTSR